MTGNKKSPLLLPQRRVSPWKGSQEFLLSNKKYTHWQTKEKGKEQASSFPLGFNFSLLRPSQIPRVWEPQCQPSTLLTIFLLPLLREPLLREFLILILVPLPAEVQVLGLGGKQSSSPFITQPDHL